MSYYYILDDEGNPQPIDDILTWGAWFESADRTLARETVGPAEVSTVFLSLNHQWGDGPPILFETLVFVPDDDGDWYGVEGSMRRYETREQALAGHAEVVAFLRSLPEQS